MGSKRLDTLMFTAVWLTMPKDRRQILFNVYTYTMNDSSLKRKGILTYNVHEP